MGNTLKVKRGTNLSNAGTPAAGELIYKTDTNQLFVGDGSTAATGLTAIGGSGATGDIEGVTAGTGLSGGGTSGTVTLNIDSTVATLTGSQTLTNKTLASPTVTGNLIADSIDVAGDITLDADGADVILKDGGTEYGRLTQLLGGLTLKSGSSSANAVIFSTDGDAIFAEDVSISAGKTFTFDSVGLTAVQTSSESFADNNTSLMTSAAINDRIESFGYITADTTLSTEQVQDIVGAMFSSNTETRISATYQDGDGTIDLVVDDMTANDNTVTTNIAGTGISVSSGTGNSTISTNDSEIVHDNLSGFVANEHIDHSSVTIYAGAGLTGGGNITASRNIHVGGGTGITVNADNVAINFKDEDDMSSNSASHAATQQSIKAYVDAEVAGIVNSAPSALNTLDELAAALGDDANFATTTSTSLGNRLRVDTASQGLTGTQQANAITNLGITATKAELNYVDGVTSAIQTQLDAKLTSSSSLNGSNISSGTVAAARIANLAASKITSGTFDAARIAHDSFHLGATSAETGRTVKEDGLYTYEVNNASLGTGTETGYYEVLTWGDGTGGSVQLAGQWFSGTAPNMYFRTLRDVSDDWTTWQRLLTTSDEGSGNGLDADTLDGSHASAFLTTSGTAANSQLLDSIDSTGFTRKGVQSGTPNTASNRTTFTCNDDIETSNGNQSGLEVWQDTSGADAFMTFHVAGDYAGYFGLDGSTNDLSWGGWSNGNGNKYRVFHAGNSTNITSVGTINTGTWNGSVIASAYLDADTAHLSGSQTFSGAKTFTGRLTISDAGADGLHLNQDTSTNTNSNRLFFTGSSAGSAIFQSGSVLSFRSGATAGSSSGTERMHIDTNGIDVTGSITVSGTVDGRDVASDGSKLDGIESGATADQTKADIDALGINATTLDNFDSTRFFRRDGAATATVGPGWMTVATNTSGRRAGEILVTDGDSGDHGFIRIHWLRSYMDSNFTVINCGGHQNRITGVRVLSQDSDNTYGEKILQVYVEANSSYDVKIFKMGDDAHYTAHTVHTPTIENSITGYSLHGNQLEDLDTYGFAHEEGILAGGNIEGQDIISSGTMKAFRLDILEGTTIVGDIQATDTTWLRINQSTAKNIYTPRYIRADSGFFVDGASLGINGTGTLRAENGSAGTPSMSFSSDTNTGFYRQAAEHIGVSLAGAEEFRFDQNGSNGDFHATGDVVAYSTTPSDIKLKKNVKDIEYGLDDVMKLNPKEYDWKKDDRHDIGFIAQEVEEVIPEIVKDKKWFDDKVKTLDYEKLTAVLIKAVQELKAEVEELKK